MLSRDLPAGSVEYRKSGTSGSAKSTVDGKKAAITVFNDFLLTKRMQTFDKLSEAELCNVDLFREYGTYLSVGHRQAVFEWAKGQGARALSWQRYLGQ